jgi:hypothetical protein
MTPVMYSIFFLEGLLVAASLLEVPGVRWPRSWLIELACFLYQIPQGRHEPNLCFLSGLEPNDRTGALRLLAALSLCSDKHNKQRAAVARQVHGSQHTGGGCGSSAYENGFYLTLLNSGLLFQSGSGPNIRNNFTKLKSGLLLLIHVIL